MMEDIIKVLVENRETFGLLIAWLPTLIFLFFLFIAIIAGMIRGFRKSMILFIHMLIAGGICLGIFLFIVNTPEMDASIVKFVNDILGKFNMSIQGMLGVSSSYESLHQMIMYFITSNMDEGDLAYHLIVDNGAYIATIVEMVYRIVLATLLSAIYVILLIILRLIYAIFYPVKRTIKKHNEKFKKGEVPYPYKKRRLMGGFIGCVRGIINSLITLSFVGALIFVISGGITNPSREELSDTAEEISFGNDAANLVYDYYSYICEMGDTGVFKVLNNIKDPNNTPYYFYICDLILQGSVIDEKLGVDGTFYIRDEIGNYVKFTKDVMTLILKYANQEELDIITGNVNNVQGGTEISTNGSSTAEDTDVLNTILGIMAKPGFSEDFVVIIDEFEAKTYFVNIALSTLTSLINHVDLLNVSEEVKGLIKCLFVDGDYSIKVTDLVTEKDVKNLFKTVVSLIANAEVEESDNETETTINYVKSILPIIQELSIFDDRKDTGNKLLSSLYTYCAETFVTDVSLPEIPENMDWVKELNTLLRVVDPFLTIYGNVSEGDVVENLFYMFDAKNPDVSENEEAWDIMVDCLSDSLILDVIFKSSLVTDVLNSTISGITGNPETVIPLGNISFGNTVDEEGNIVYGECYNLFSSLKQLFKSDNKTLVDLINGNGTDSISDIVGLLGDDLYPEDPNKNQTLSDYLLESKVLQYSLSAILSETDFGGFKLSVPTSATDLVVENEVEYRVIKKIELKKLVDALSNSLDTILDLAESSSIDIKAVINDDALVASIESSLILEGTVANIISSTLADIDAITIPYGYDSADPWVNIRDEAGNVTTKGELKLLIEAISATEDVDGFDIDDLLEGSFEISMLENLPDDVLETMLKSKVLHYTFSSNVTSMSGDMNIIVPKKSLASGNHKDVDEKAIRVIEEEELIAALNAIFKVVDFDNGSVIKYGTLFNEKDSILESAIVSATIIDMLNESGSISIPKTYKNALVAMETVEENIWFGATDSVTDDELYIFLSSVEELLGGSIDDDFELDDINNIKIKNSSTGALSRSVVMNATVSDKLITGGLSIPIQIDEKIIYENDMVVKTELDSLFTNLIALFGSGEGEERCLTMSELTDISLESTALTKTELNNALASSILAYSISKKVLDVDSLMVPTTTVRNDINIVNDQNKHSMILTEDLDKLFDALYVMFGKTKGEDVVLEINSIDADDLVLRNSTMPILFNSTIMASTISHKITAVSSLYVPEDEYDTIPRCSSTIEYINVVRSEELDRLFVVLFALFAETDGEDKILDVNDIHADDLVLKPTDMEMIYNSVIMNATVSHNVAANDMLSVPSDTFELTSVYNKNEDCPIIDAAELKKVFDILFLLFDKDADGLDINKDITDEITIDNDNKDVLLSSAIMSATISSNITDNTTGIIIVEELLYEQVLFAQGLSKLIERNELLAFINSLITMNGKLSTNDTDLESMGLPKEEDKRNALVSSVILRSTVSEQVFANNSTTIKIAVSEKDAAFKCFTYEEKEVVVLTAKELLALMNGMDHIGGSNFSSISISIDDLMNSPDKNAEVDAINASAVLRYVLSKKLLTGSTPAYKMILHEENIGGDVCMEPSIYSGYYNIKPLDYAVSVSGFTYITDSQEIMFNAATLNALKTCDYGID